MSIDKIKNLNGGDRFLELTLRVLPLSEKQALFFAMKVYEYQRTGNLEHETLLKVKNHFFNIASTKLKAMDIPDFQNHWRYYTWLMIICRCLEDE